MVVLAHPVAEDWTFTYLEGTDPRGKAIHYKVEGSVTGPDGEGWTTNRFRSASGRAVLDPKDINCVWQYQYSKKQAKPGFQVKWETAPLFADPYVPQPADARTTLVQNCANGRHVLTLDPGKGGKPGIRGFIVYRPAK